MKKTKNVALKKLLYGSLGVVSLLIIWEIVALIVNDPLIFPHLGPLFVCLFNLLAIPSVYTAFGQTLLRTLIALMISLILGFSLGLLGGLFERFRYFMAPLVKIMKLVPTPILVFILFIFFFNAPNVESSIITLIIVFPIIYESMVTGLLNIDDSIKESLMLEGYYSFNSVFKVQVVEALPYLMLGILNSFTLGVKVSVTSEILVGTSKIWGIGRLIYAYRIDSDYPNMIAVGLLIIIIFIIIDLITILVKHLLKLDDKELKK